MALLNVIIEQAILYKKSVKITFQVSENKISTLFTELRALVQKEEKWCILTTTGLAIELEHIKSIVLA